MPINFHAQHSPFGAHASFTMGKIGSGGGFGLELGAPAKQNLFIAYNRNGEKPRAMPFFKSQVSALEAFGITDPKAAKDPFAAWKIFQEKEMQREMGWASDAWLAGDLSFKLLTPFGAVPDPDSAAPEELKLKVIPAILAEIGLDNRKSKKAAWIFFGSGSNPGPIRPLSDTTNGRLLGMARERSYGFAAKASGDKVAECQTFDLAQAIEEGQGDLLRLTTNGGLFFKVAPGKQATFTVALGFYRAGLVTSGLETEYLYTRYYANLEEVLETALDRAAELKAEAARRDAELKREVKGSAKQFLLAHATHSYLGSTQLLSRGGKALWVVNEGEYQMMNTFDLAVDHLFYEMRFHPWTVRNMLDLYCDRYSYYDQAIDVLDGRKAYPGGLSFTHDMGVANQFSKPQWSSYELTDSTDLFSHMTHEQLLNWVLSAVTYVLGQMDNAWLEKRQGLFSETLQSLLHRDHHDPAQRNGVMSLDSSRCGSRGQEVSTYDSLDSSLAQTRGNLYAAVKTWSAYLGLGLIFDKLGNRPAAKLARTQAERSAATISGKMGPKGFIPAVFGENETSQILPAVEGLVFPHVWGLNTEGAFGELYSALRKHIKTVLKSGVCIDGKSGGWKMSSTSQNTWMSKIAISQFVVMRVLKMPYAKDEAAWDLAHARWQQVGCGDWAFCDQVRSHDGHPLGSRYYPRGVTNILWAD